MSRYSDNSYRNQGAGGYGQNLASYGSSSNSGSDTDAIARAITTQWYGGEFAAYANFFGMANPPSSSFGAYGHLTQVVWKSSTEVGCYTARCPAGTVLGMESSYSVCNYNPPGKCLDFYMLHLSDGLTNRSNRQLRWPVRQERFGPPWP